MSAPNERTAAGAEAKKKVPAVRATIRPWDTWRAEERRRRGLWAYKRPLPQGARWRSRVKRCAMTAGGDVVLVFTRGWDTREQTWWCQVGDAVPWELDRPADQGDGIILALPAFPLSPGHDADTAPALAVACEHFVQGYTAAGSALWRVMSMSDGVPPQVGCLAVGYKAMAVAYGERKVWFSEGWAAPLATDADPKALAWTEAQDMLAVLTAERVELYGPAVGGDAPVRLARLAGMAVPRLHTTTALQSEDDATDLANLAMPSRVLFAPATAGAPQRLVVTCADGFAVFAASAAGGCLTLLHREVSGVPILGLVVPNQSVVALLTPYPCRVLLWHIDTSRWVLRVRLPSTHPHGVWYLPAPLGPAGPSLERLVVGGADGVVVLEGAAVGVACAAGQCGSGAGRKRPRSLASDPPEHSLTDEQKRRRKLRTPPRGSSALQPLSSSLREANSGLSEGAPANNKITCRACVAHAAGKRNHRAHTRQAGCALSKCTPRASRGLASPSVNAGVDEVPAAATPVVDDLLEAAAALHAAQQRPPESGTAAVADGDVTVLWTPEKAVVRMPVDEPRELQVPPGAPVVGVVVAGADVLVVQEACVIRVAAADLDEQQQFHLPASCCGGDGRAAPIVLPARRGCIVFPATGVAAYASADGGVWTLLRSPPDLLRFAASVGDVALAKRAAGLLGFDARARNLHVLLESLLRPTASCTDRVGAQ
eukprot:TRINITY_DN16835_c0_g1_i2.p1 TRINITY_DN16835_c0_g1~~TRINITY_DN16835_c0_g1_i2.p1  ORF type:complete len:712 (+),score=109.15 TRINITY_DN16835_c0_g1_i2:72-2207(+)